MQNEKVTDQIYTPRTQKIKAVSVRYPRRAFQSKQQPLSEKRTAHEGEAIAADATAELDPDGKHALRISTCFERHKSTF